MLIELFVFLCWVVFVILGCVRNEVDFEEFVARLLVDGWIFVDDPDDADVVLVNICGFIEVVKRDLIDIVLDVFGEGCKVVVVGCLVEWYGNEFVVVLLEVDVVLGFDAYG